MVLVYYFNWSAQSSMVLILWILSRKYSNRSIRETSKKDICKQGTYNDRKQMLSQRQQANSNPNN